MPAIGRTEPGPAAMGIDRPVRGLLHLRMVAEAEIVVGTEHEDPLPVDLAPRVLGPSGAPEGASRAARSRAAEISSKNAVGSRMALTTSLRARP